MTRLTYAPIGTIHAWRLAYAPRIARVIAADAVTLAAMIRNREIHPSWRIYGSPEQADGLFVAAHPDVLPTDIAALSFGDAAVGFRRLLPSGAEWLPMGIADLEEFCL